MLPFDWRTLLTIMFFSGICRIVWVPLVVRENERANIGDSLRPMRKGSTTTPQKATIYADESYPAIKVGAGSGTATLRALGSELLCPKHTSMATCFGNSP